MLRIKMTQIKRYFLAEEANEIQANLLIKNDLFLLFLKLYITQREQYLLFNHNLFIEYLIIIFVCSLFLG